MKTAVVAVVITLMAVSMASGNVRAYAIDPVRADWSGKADPNPLTGGVSQEVVCCWDTLERIELFAGAKGNGGAYTAIVYEGGAELTRSAGNGVPDHGWVKFSQWDQQVAFTKGKELTIRFTRGGSDSVQYYYSGGDPYPYGAMLVPGQGPTDADLACRVYGRMKAVDSTYFGADEVSWKWGDTRPINVGTFRARIEESRVRTVRFDLDWSQVQPHKSTCDWILTDSTLKGIRADSGCRPLALVTMTPVGDAGEDSWASTRYDNKNDSGDSAWSPHCAPRGLEYPVTSDSNLLARFIDSVVHHYDSGNFKVPIHDWEVWNEPNDTTTDTSSKATGWWRRPDSVYYPLGPGLRPLCSLYMRMAQVVDSAVKRHPGHETDKVAIGSMAGVVGGCPVPGKDWLDNCYAADSESHMGVFWDAVSVHDYQDIQDGFVPETLRVHAETLRATMRKWSDLESELWNTEFGWNRVDTADPEHYSQSQDARNLCEAFVSHKASEADPGGGYDRLYWWYFRRPGVWNAWGLVSDSLDPQAPFYAMKQVAGGLTGKRLNGRVMVGDSAGDAHVRMYEFEDSASLKKTWVCWSTAQDPYGVVAGLPVRLDTATATVLDYGDDPQPSDDPTAATGWLWPVISSRPVFITEPEERAISRPELVAESLWLSPLWSGLPCIETLHVKIKNRDSQESTPAGCATWVRFTWNGSIVDSTCRTVAIGPSETVVESFVWELPLAFHGDGLLTANVNPGMRYVERDGTDDNQAYQRLVIRGAIGGTLAVTAPPGGKTDAPLLVCGLSSMSYEKDSTGQTPADSARVLFAWYGAHGDSVVHATDTSAWFPFCSDTALVFPRGCGVYRVQAQYRDSGASDSPFYGDSTDSIVVFDSVPPAGSIVVEGGRFASNSTRTLRLAASDSASGVCDMRFMNRGRVSLTRNGAFDPAGGCWSFAGSGCGYDTSLQMGRLAVGSAQTTVRQFVPAESISAYSGDSCVLEASILAHVHNGEATGDVSFWFYSIRVDSLNLHDTLWALVDSACYSGDLLSLTGRSNLSTRFLLSTPTPESGWVWRGGMVRVRAQGVDDGTGTVWCDNVLMNVYEPQAGGYAWWGQYDSVAQWDIGSSAGQHVVGMCLRDSAGAENTTPHADTVILDPTPPVVDISLPMIGQLVNGSAVQVTGWAFDPIEIAGDTWFSRRTLTFRHADSTNWLPVSPDSTSLDPAYPDSMASQGPAVHLGYWNTLGLEDGTYYLLLTASDSAGNTSNCTTWVMVDQGFGGGGMCGGPEGGGSGLGEGSVFVGSSTGNVLHLSDDLDSLDAFSVDDSGSQANVTAIVEVGEDSILILDGHNKRVHKLHRSGQHRRRLVSGLSQPTDLKRDANGNFWLVDRGWNRIGKFRSNGTLVFVRGGLGADSLHFHSPEGIAVKGGLVYVADGGNNRIAVWDTSGHFKTTITGDFENPTAVWVMESGAIYLTDGTDGKLKGITPLGGNIVSIGASDSSKLRGLVPSENRHSLFTLAPQPNKVYKLRIQSDDTLHGGQQSAGKVNLPKTLSLNQPFPNPARTRLNIAYALPRQTRVELKLYDVAGKLVTTLANGEQKPGYYNLTWNRQDTKGRSCACGVYFCTLAAENQRFSRKVILTE